MEPVGVFRGFILHPVYVLMRLRLKPIWVVLLLLLLLYDHGELLPFLAAAAVHECGHLGAARLIGVKTRQLSTISTGLQLTFATESLSYGREIWILAGGSLAGLCSLGFVDSGSAYYTCALGLNLVNLLPIGGLDGGGILHCLLHHILEGDRADRWCRTVSLLFSIVFWLAGVWIVLRVRPNISWMVCGMAAVYKSLKEYEGGG